MQLLYVFGDGVVPDLHQGEWHTKPQGRVIDGTVVLWVGEIAPPLRNGLGRPPYKRHGEPTDLLLEHIGLGAVVDKRLTTDLAGGVDWVQARDVDGCGLRTLAAVNTFQVGQELCHPGMLVANRFHDVGHICHLAEELVLAAEFRQFGGQVGMVAGQFPTKHGAGPAEHTLFAEEANLAKAVFGHGEGGVAVVFAGQNIPGFFGLGDGLYEVVFAIGHQIVVGDLLDDELEAGIAQDPALPLRGGFVDVGQDGIGHSRGTELIQVIGQFGLE